MKVKWNIETGYVANIPDWVYELEDDDLETLQEVGSALDLENLLYDWIQEEFNQRITFYISNIDEILEEIEKRWKKVDGSQS